MKLETITQEALRLVSKVPAKEFITNNLSDLKNKCCFVGHYARLKSDNPNNYETQMIDNKNRNELVRITKIFIKNKYNENASMIQVNDTSKVNNYNQKGIKARGIALLKDMVKAGY